MGNQLTWGQLNGVVVYWGNRYQRERSLTIELTIIESVNGVMMMKIMMIIATLLINKVFMGGHDLRYPVPEFLTTTHLNPKSKTCDGVNKSNWSQFQSELNVMVGHRI